MGKLKMLNILRVIFRKRNTLYKLKKELLIVKDFRSEVASDIKLPKWNKPHTRWFIKYEGKKYIWKRSINRTLKNLMRTKPEIFPEKIGETENFMILKYVELEDGDFFIQGDDIENIDRKFEAEIAGNFLKYCVENKIRYWHELTNSNVIFDKNNQVKMIIDGKRIRPVWSITMCMSIVAIMSWKYNSERTKTHENIFSNHDMNLVKLLRTIMRNIPVIANNEERMGMKRFFVYIKNEFKITKIIKMP